MNEEEIDDDFIIDLPDAAVIPDTAPAPRYAVSLRVIWDNGDRVASGPAMNLSQSGIFIRTAEPPPVGKVVRLMPMINGENANLVLNGKVVRVADQPVPGMGIQFTPQNRQERRQLETFFEMYAAKSPQAR
jgi:Tfp pilus assembly protein PilZ